jgi:hypothetical protein
LFDAGIRTTQKGANTMPFVLEALEAKQGDALLLHYGKDSDPKLIVIDGGPSGVYAGSLKPRLEEIKQERSPDDPLPIRMVMVSHMDDDHINGILQMVNQLVGLKERHKPLPYDIITLWHNSFDDLLGNEAGALVASLKTAVQTASSSSFSASLPVRRDTALVLASVNQGRQLRDAANRLGIGVNDGFGSLVMVPAGKKSRVFDAGDGLKLTVMGPDEERVKALQKEWDKQIKQLGVAQAADFADKSVFNLASITVLAAFKKKTMLLTGDARGDYVLAGLRRAKLLKNGKLHVNLLKLPHHGSDNNVDTDFFRAITADHYVVSGDGEHGNPEVSTFQMISDARGQDEFTIHLTHGKLPEDPRPNKLLDFFRNEKQAGKQYTTAVREEVALGIAVDLLV